MKLDRAFFAVIACDFCSTRHTSATAYTAGTVAARLRMRTKL